MEFLIIGTLGLSAFIFIYAFIKIKTLNAQNLLLKEKLQNTKDELLTRENLLMHSNDEITSLKERMLESGKLRFNILSNISHEFRSPINSVVGFAELLQHELKNTPLGYMTDSILHSSERILHSLNSLITFVELESKSSITFYQPVDFVNSLHSIFTFYQEQFLLKGLTFEVVKPTEVLVVSAYLPYLNEIVTNLLENAFTFTKIGGVKITFEVKEDHGVRFGIISISDTGIGIPDDKRQLIFEEFRQVSEGIEREYEGNGLGLAIARRMANLMKGKITVESEFGKGSTFSLWVPAADEEDVARLLESHNSELNNELQDSLQILDTDELPTIIYAEDSMMNKILMDKILENICAIEHAIDGTNALRIASEKKFPLVILDINLSREMSGVEVMKRLRELPEYQRTPIIAVSGYIQPLYKMELLNEGFNDFLAKPYKKNEVISCVKRFLTTSNKQEGKTNE